MRILIVEDEVLIRMAAVDMVESMGHQALEAGCADEAITMVADGAVDLLFTDVGLPGRSGTDLARQVRTHWPHIKIIFATGHHLNPEKIDAALLSQVATIGKPYDERAIETAIGAVTAA